MKIWVKELGRRGFSSGWQGCSLGFPSGFAREIPWSSPASPRKTLSFPPLLLRLTQSKTKMGLRAAKLFLKPAVCFRSKEMVQLHDPGVKIWLEESSVWYFIAKLDFHNSQSFEAAFPEFLFNQPTGQIQSLNCDVNQCVCLCVPLHEFL